MDTKNKESKGSGATASKTTATGSQAAGITPQQTHGMAGAPHDQTSQKKQQNQGNGEPDLMQELVVDRVEDDARGALDKVQDAARQMGSEGQQQPPA
jgi:hypothetical protein